MNTLLLHGMAYKAMAFGPLALLVMGAWIYALVDVVRSEFKVPTNKVTWIMVLMFMPFLGVILYFLFGSKQKEEVVEDHSEE